MFATGMGKKGLVLGVCLPVEYRFLTLGICLPALTERLRDAWWTKKDNQLNFIAYTVQVLV